MDPLVELLIRPQRVGLPPPPPPPPLRADQAWDHPGHPQHGAPPPRRAPLPPPPKKRP